ncbi:MAG: polyphosphate kinase 2 family protein [Anaerolineales bacterium]|nr:polyphosphate kinase 2 family protein [Anaerolineales bacterium]
MVDIKKADVQKLAERYLVKPGKDVDLTRDFPTDDSAGYEKPDNAGEILQVGVDFLAGMQERLYAENRRGLLIILQALDAAGKDSTIAHVMSGVNPQGCEVTSSKAPSAEELSHDYLWRCVRNLPRRGMIGIFNRSYYEEVLVVRVHPSFLTAQRLPPQTLGKGLWKQRFEEINNFEKYLVGNGFEIVKIFLTVGKVEQCGRQLERIDKPDKNWKFNAGDLDERNYWNDYLKAYEDLFRHTSTPWAPWYVLPADKKWFTRIAAAAVIANKLIEMDPQYPTVSAEDRESMATLRERLVNECGEPGEAAATKKKNKKSKHKKD